MLRQTSEPLSFHCAILLLRRFTLRAIGSIAILRLLFSSLLVGWAQDTLRSSGNIERICESSMLSFDFLLQFFFSYDLKLSEIFGVLLPSTNDRPFDGVSGAVTFGLILGQFGIEDFPRKMMFYSFGEFGCGNVSRCHLCANGNQQSVDLCTD